MSEGKFCARFKTSNWRSGTLGLDVARLTRGAKLCSIGVEENAMQHPLKNFSQKKIEATIGGALCQLTGANYTVDIKSIESLAGC